FLQHLSLPVGRRETLLLDEASQRLPGGLYPLLVSPWLYARGLWPRTLWRRGLAPGDPRWRGLRWRFLSPAGRNPAVRRHLLPAVPQRRPGVFSSAGTVGSRRRQHFRRPHG